MAGTIRHVADYLETEAGRATGRGEHESAVAMLKAALKLRGLPLGESLANLQEMTGAQLQRRGKAIAKAKAAKSDDRLWSAIVASKWGSQEVYAKKRLGVSPGSLSAYRSGNTPCPRPVAAKVLADFKIGDDYWPGGVVE